MKRKNTKQSDGEEEQNSEEEDQDGMFEKILGVRKSGAKTEYLVKFKGKSYHQIQWLKEKYIASFKDGDAMINKLSKGNPLPTEEPFFDPEFLKIDRIVARHENGYLVKWMNLGYDQLTVEENVENDQILFFESREKALFSSAKGKFKAIEDLHPESEFPWDTQNMDMHNLPTLNILMSNFNERKPTELYSELGQSYMTTIAGFFSTLHNKYGIHGPFLVIMPQGQLSQWNYVLRELNNLKTVVYTGSKEVRKQARDIDFYKEDQTTLNFHILLTTPEIIRKDADILNDIFWQSIVVDAPSRAKGKLITNFGSFVAITITRLRTRGSEVQKILDIMSTQEAIQRILSKESMEQVLRVKQTLQHASKRAKSSADAAIPKIICRTIRTPINETQKKEIRIAVSQAKESIKNKDFMGLSTRILRILTHPYINMYREYYNGTLYSNASTKVTVISHLISDSLEREGKILIVTEYNTFADIVEDICDEASIRFHRISPESTENEMLEPKVLICDQSFTRLSLDINFLPFLCNNVDTVILVDGDSQSIISTLRLGMSVASTIRRAFKLECSECDESELYALCRKTDFGAIDNAKAEAICKRAVLTAYQPEKEISIEKLIADDQSAVAKEDFLQDQFTSLDFWKIILEDKIEESEPKLDDTTEREWTIRERNQLLRFSTSLGIDRGDLVSKYSGVRITPEIAVRVGIQFLRVFTRSTKGSVSYLRARQLIDGDEEEPYFETGVWAVPSFRADLKANCTALFRRIDSILHMKDELSEAGSYTNLQRYSIGSHTDLPTEVWTDNDDKALIYGTVKYGFGKYDWFVVDDDKNVSSLFVSEGEELQRYKLSKRVVKIGEALKRKRDPKSSLKQQKGQPKAPPRKKTNDDEGVHTEWIKRDQDAVRNTLLVTGIPQTAEGKRDWETFRLTLQFRERSAEEVKKYVESYLEDCERSAPSTKKQCKKSKNDSDDGKVPPQTADKIIKRVNALDCLRKMFRLLSDEDLERHFAKAQDRRDLPEEFTPAMEVIFFKKFLNYGFGNAARILTEEPFDTIFDPDDLPASLTADHKQIQRIKVLYDALQKTTDKNTKSTSKSGGSKRKPEPKSKPKPTEKKTTKKSPANETKEQIELPYEISQGAVLESLGEIVYDRTGFYNQRYIFPAGYSIIKMYASPTKKHEKCKWRCEILDDGSKDPLFKITCLEDESFTFQGYTPTAPWTGLTKYLQKNLGLKTGAPSGCGAYCLTSLAVENLINNLPNADKCIGYVRRNKSSESKGSSSDESDDDESSE